MQLYARDSEGKRFFVYTAERGKDYFCLECSGRVRVRSGLQMRAHFYHMTDGKSCRQSGKSGEHIAIQRHILQQIGQDRGVEEMRFDAIGRVADVAWPEKKILFEVQCSPISAQEVEERNRDYASEGFSVIWILYDKTFNQVRLTAAEKTLQKSTHYYSDGKSIYDQCHVVSDNRRFLFSKTRSVDVSTCDLISFESIPHSISQQLCKRFTDWSYCAHEDYLWSSLYAQDDSWQEAMKAHIAKEQKLKKRRFVPLTRLLGFFRTLWYIVLERSCH